MDKKCPKCLYIGKSNFKYRDNFRVPIAGLFLGLLFYWIPIKYLSSFGWNFDTYFFIALPSFALLIGAVLILSFYFDNRNQCSKCGYGHMHKIEDSQTAK